MFALIAHAACAKIPGVCEKFVRKIANYINSSPKRSAIFREFCECFQKNNHKMLKLSDTRWLYRHACVKRVLESWDTIQHFLTDMVITQKSTSGENLLCMMQNVDIKAYLLFLKYILHFFNNFNIYFQAVETRIQLLQSKSMDLLTQISNFLKPEFLNDLLNIEFEKTATHKSLEDIRLGSECEEYLRKLIKDEHINIAEVIRRNCLEFYITAAKEIRKRLPVNDKFLSKLKVLQPQILFHNDRESSFNDIFFIAETIGSFDEMALKKEWFSLHSDFTIMEKQNLSLLNFDNMWKEILQYQYSTNVIKFPNLKYLLNAIRALPNSNADSERVFSFLTDVKRN